MMSFITDNMGTLCISSVLAVCVFAAVRKIIKDRKNGHGSCGCGCSSCAASSVCHGGCKGSSEK